MSLTDDALSGVISASGLTRRFGQVVAVHPMDLSVAAGSVVGILGPNGSGKSTFLRMLVGLVRPDAGEAQVDGVTLAGDGTAVRKRCTYTPGELALYGEMRGDEHLRWLLRGRQQSAVPRAFELGRELGLPLRDRVRSYSHGMKRQLLFASALAPDVRVRILDEPTEGLDPAKRSTMLGALADDAARGTTVLLSSHHLGEVESLCDRLIFFHAGKLLSDESPAALRLRERRTVRIVFGRTQAPEHIEHALAGPGVESVGRHGERYSVLLEHDDPRPFLARLAADPDLPAPAEVVYGQLSLTELYRELYGVEGL